jgi:hypothetical protein
MPSSKEQAVHSEPSFGERRAEREATPLSSHADLSVSLRLPNLEMPHPLALHHIGTLQRIVGNRAVARILMAQRQVRPIERATTIHRQIADPKDAGSFEAWMKSFPNYIGPGDIDMTKDAPLDLKALINGEPHLPPDCADISLLLRHYYLKSKDENFTIRTGPKSKPLIIGKGVSDRRIKQHMINLGSINFQEERKRFAMINYYKSGGKRITNLNTLILAGLKSGEVFVWKRLPSIRGNFQGHVQTLQDIDPKTKTVTVVQGNMVAGKGVGALQQRHYTFEQLTGDAEGNADIQDAAEEYFFGAGPWR